jgi:hypothetical protein
MFHLPQEIIRNIYEFDPTYREEYKNVLQDLKMLPVFDYYKPKSNYFYVSNSVLDELPSKLPPSKMYFQFLRSSNSLCKSVKYKFDYNIVIYTLSYRHYLQTMLKIPFFVSFC